MPGPDFTEPMRRIDALQERLDQVFQRVNADPVYRTEQTIADAISDNPRYLDSDRKSELAEIFFAILDQIYEKIVKQDTSDPFCNPAVEPGGRARLPQTEMLMRERFSQRFSRHRAGHSLTHIFTSAESAADPAAEYHRAENSFAEYAF